MGNSFERCRASKHAHLSWPWKHYLILVPKCLNFVSVYYHTTTLIKPGRGKKKKCIFNGKRCHDRIFPLVLQWLTDFVQRLLKPLSMLLLTSRGLYAHSSEQLFGGSMTLGICLIASWSGSSNDEAPPSPKSVRPKLPLTRCTFKHLAKTVWHRSGCHVPGTSTRIWWRSKHLQQAATSAYLRLANTSKTPSVSYSSVPSVS